MTDNEIWIPIDRNETSTINGKELMWEMANIPHRLHKELPSNIWISAKNANHGPRIKVQKNKGDSFQLENSFSMTIADTPKIIGDKGKELSPKDISYFVNFILRNKKDLIEYWNGQLATEEILAKLIY